MTGGGGFGWEPGEWTDDTQMSIAIVDAADGSAFEIPARAGIPLLLESADAEEQARLHRAVGELFCAARRGQIEVQARVQVSPVNQKPARLIFERLV